MDCRCYFSSSVNLNLNLFWKHCLESTAWYACFIYWIPQHHLSHLHHLLDTSAPLVSPAPSTGYLSTTCLACTIYWIPQHHSWVAKHVQTFSQTYTYTKRLHVKTYADVPFLLTLHMDTALIIHVHLLINQINTKLISILLPGENGCCKSKTSKENTKYNILHIQTADSEQTTLIIMTTKKEKKKRGSYVQCAQWFCCILPGLLGHSMSWGDFNMCRSAEDDFPWAHKVARAHLDNNSAS